MLFKAVGLIHIETYCDNINDDCYGVRQDYVHGATCLFTNESRITLLHSAGRNWVYHRQ